MATGGGKHNSGWRQCLARLSAGVAIVLIAASAMAQPGAADRESRPLGPATPRAMDSAGSEAGTTDDIARDSRSPTTGGGGSAGGLGGSAIRTGGALGLVLTLIFAAARGYKWFAARSGVAALGAASGAGRVGPAGVLEVLGRYPIARGQALMLLRVDNRVLLVGQCGGGGGGLRLRAGGGAGAGSMTTLCELSSPDEVASILLKTRDSEQESMAERFKGLLGRFDRAHGGEVVDVRRRRMMRGAAESGGGGVGSDDVVEVWDERADASVFASVDVRPAREMPDGASVARTLRAHLAAMRAGGGAGGGVAGASGGGR